MTTLNQYREKLMQGTSHSFGSLYMSDDKLTELLASLGLTIEPEKPAPGVYLTVDGYAVIVGGPGINHCGGNVALINGGLESIDDSWKLRPAYVVSEAEYKRLTRDAGPVGKVAAWDKLRQHSAFDDLTSGEGSLADRMIGRLNDLTKAPAAPVELPGRDEVRAVLTDWYRSKRSAPLSEAVDAVMGLIERTHNA